MPIKIPEALPAAAMLEKENIFTITESRAMKQDIRPLKIAILNLMPTKIVTETQFLRLLSNTPLQIDITLLITKTHTPKNTPMEHLKSFYKYFVKILIEGFQMLQIGRIVAFRGITGYGSAADGIFQLLPLGFGRTAGHLTKSCEETQQDQKNSQCGQQPTGKRKCFFHGITQWQT